MRTMKDWPSTWWTNRIILRRKSLHTNNQSSSSFLSHCWSDLTRKTRHSSKGKGIRWRQRRSLQEWVFVWSIGLRSFLFFSSLIKFICLVSLDTSTTNSPRLNSSEMSRSSISRWRTAIEEEWDDLQIDWQIPFGLLVKANQFKRTDLKTPLCLISMWHNQLEQQFLFFSYVRVRLNASSTKSMIVQRWSMKSSSFLIVVICRLHKNNV